MQSMKNLALPKKKAFYANAPVLKRILAFIIDILIVNMIVLFPFRGIFNKIMPQGDSFSETFQLLNSQAYSQALSIIMFAVSFMTIIYFMLFEKKLQQTPGKIIMNLYIETAKKDLKYWQLFLRSMFLIPIFPFILLWVIDPIVIFFTKENQRLSEIISNTKTVEKYKLK